MLTLIIFSTVLYSQDVKFKNKEKVVKDVILNLAHDTTWTHKTIDNKAIARFNDKLKKVKVDKSGGKYVSSKLLSPGFIEFEILNNGVKEVVTVTSGDSLVYIIESDSTWEIKGRKIIYHSGFYTPYITADVKVDTATIDVFQSMYRDGNNRLIIKFDTSYGYPIIIDPSIIYTGKGTDTYIKSNDVNANILTAVNMSQYLSGAIFKMLIYEDSIDVIPALATIDSAFYSLYQYSIGSGGNTITWYWCDQLKPIVWDEVTYTVYSTGNNWGTLGMAAGGDYHTNIFSDAVAVSANGVRYRWDMTPLVRAARDSSGHSGFVAIATAGSGNANFRTSEYTTEAERPIWEIYYTEAVPDSTEPSIAIDTLHQGFVIFDSVNNVGNEDTVSLIFRESWYNGKWIDIDGEYSDTEVQFNNTEIDSELVIVPVNMTHTLLYWYRFFETSIWYGPVSRTFTDGTAPTGGTDTVIIVSDTNNIFVDSTKILSYSFENPTNDARVSIIGDMNQLVTGTALNSGTPVDLAANMGIGKLRIEIESGTDLDGTIRVGGAWVDRDGEIADVDSFENITIVPGDSCYLTSFWFTDSSTAAINITTADVNAVITVDQVSFWQNDRPSSTPYDVFRFGASHYTENVPTNLIYFELTFVKISAGGDTTSMLTPFQESIFDHPINTLNPLSLHRDDVLINDGYIDADNNEGIICFYTSKNMESLNFLIYYQDYGVGSPFAFDSNAVIILVDTTKRPWRQKLKETQIKF